MYSIGKYSTNYQTLEMEFLAPDGKRVVLRGMPNEALGSATAKGMTTIFRHEDKTHTRKLPTPTHKTSRKEQWYAKGFVISQIDIFLFLCVLFMASRLMPQ